MNSVVKNFKTDVYQNVGHEFLQNSNQSDTHPASDLFIKYYAALRRGWWIIVLSLILAIVVAVMFSKLTTPKYHSFATLEIKQQESNILGGSLINEIEANEEFMVTQIALLKSSSLMGEVVKDLQLENDENYTILDKPKEERVESAIQSLQKNVSINRIRNSRIIEIRMQDIRPQIAALVPNTLAKTFVRFTQERKFNATSFARKFVKERLDVSRVNLENSEKNLFEYSQKSGILSGGSIRNDLDSNALKLLSNELLSIRTKRLELQNKLRQPQINNDIVATSNSALGSILVQLEIDYEKKKEIYKHKHPQMISLQKQIDSIKEKISNEVSFKIDELETEFENTQILEKQYENRVKNIRDRMVANQSEDFNYNLLLREVEANRVQYDALLQRFKEISVSDGTGTDLISMIDSAVIPKKPFTPNNPVIFSIALILGLLSGVGIVLAQYFLNDLIIHPTDISQKLKLQLLGTIPLNKNKNVNILHELKDPTSQISEGYASVQSALERILIDNKGYLLHIVSAKPDEGKSSTAIGIAHSFAKSKRSVLLIDADLRKPGFQNHEDSINLSDLISGLHDFEKLAIPLSSIENLSLLQSGKVPVNPAALLSSGTFRKLLSVLKEKYDLIIIDSPPILGLADAILIGSECDGSLIVTEQNGLRSSQIITAIDRLRQAGANIIGGVLTKFDISMESKYGAYYNYYSYKENSQFIGVKTRKIHKKSRINIM